MEKRFQRVVAGPVILYKQNDATCQGNKDSPAADTDSYDLTDTESYDSESCGEQEVSGCCRTAFYTVLTEWCHFSRNQEIHRPLQ